MRDYGDFEGSLPGTPSERKISSRSEKNRSRT